MTKTSKALGKIVALNPITKILTIKLNLLDGELLEEFENLASVQQSTTITFDLPYTPSKTYYQLKRYHAMLKAILLSMNIEITSQNIKTLDSDTKERALPCEYLEIDERRISVPPPSKKDMTFDQLNLLMNWLEKTYTKVDWAAKDWYSKA